MARNSVLYINLYIHLIDSTLHGTSIALLLARSTAARRRRDCGRRGSGRRRGRGCACSLALALNQGGYFAYVRSHLGD